MYELYADASCIRGRCGWGYVLRHPDGVVTIGSGVVEGKSNINRAELVAVLEGLDAIVEPSLIDVYTDSVYVITRGRQRAHRGPWVERLLAHKGRHQIKIKKVEGHQPEHHRAHHLARDAAMTSPR